MATVGVDVGVFVTRVAALTTVGGVVGVDEGASLVAVGVGVLVGMGVSVGVGVRLGVAVGVGV